MMQTARRTRLTYGRGKLFFEPEMPGAESKGEIYIGNTPSLVTSYDRVTMSRMVSYGDQRDASEGIVIEEQHAGKFVTDDITHENVAMWYGHADLPVSTDVPQSGQVTKTLYRGRFYPVGQSKLGEVSLVSFRLRRAGSTLTIPAEGNYKIDMQRARLEILPNAVSIESGQQYVLVYTTGGSFRPKFNPASRETFGALRYVSNNPLAQDAPQIEIYYPRVRISPDGGTELKSQQNFIELGFEFKALRGSDGQYAHVLLSSANDVPLTSDEYAIIVQGGISLADFPPVEDELDRIVNVIMPSRGYPTKPLQGK